MSAGKRILYFSGKAPWSSASPASCLDALMTAAVFDAPVALVLHDDGVYQLLRHQDGAALQQKTLAKLYGALGLYGIDTVYLDRRSLERRGLGVEDLLGAEDSETPEAPLQLKPVDAEALRELIAGAAAVFNF